MTFLGSLKHCDGWFDLAVDEGVGQAWGGVGQGGGQGRWGQQRAGR